MTTPTQELREQVARIVDPEAWDEISAEDNQDGADIFADAWELALAKADAILALPPPSPVKEAVERLTDDLSRAREDGLVLTDAPNLRALLAENARLTKLVEEAGEENKRLKADVVAFCAPWAANYARDHGFPQGHLHPGHYDILRRAGARMDSFTRAFVPSPTPGDDQ